MPGSNPPRPDRGRNATGASTDGLTAAVRFLGYAVAALAVVVVVLAAWQWFVELAITPAVASGLVLFSVFTAVIGLWLLTDVRAPDRER